MTVAFDAATESSTWTTTPDPFTFTHTPSGTPRAALLAIFHPSSSVEIDSTPSYGGVTMSHGWTDGGALDGEPGRVYWYFLDGVSSGAQTVSIPHTAAATVKIATCITVTASGPVYPVRVQGCQTGPGGTLAAQLNTYLGTEFNALRFLVMYTGLGAPPTLNSGSTEVSSHDFGANAGIVSREDSESTAYVIGTTTGLDDHASLGIAISETSQPLIATYRHSFTASTTAHVVDLPPSVASGDLLLINFATSINGGSITATGGPSLTRFDDDTDLGTMVSGQWWRSCDGSEDAQTIDFVTSTATNGSGLSVVTHILAADRHTSQSPECTVTGPTASGTPDPSSLTPSWGSANNLWHLSLVRDANDGISSLGANYTNAFSYSTTTGAEIATSHRFNTATSEDPPSSTVGTTDEEFKAYLVAVRPPAAAVIPPHLDDRLLSSRALAAHLDDTYALAGL